MNKKRHPYVSEEQEGKPVFEWIVAALVAIATSFAVMGHIRAATVIIALTAIIIGVFRLVLGQRSPWKARSVGFDAFISISFGLGLLLVYFSIQMMM
ncbi:hypothetical protein GA0061078_0314 [Bifidobacterium bohemicum]|uniref:Rod shape-determining protein RodA n=1 Tax=Bifidobacterium bohemicum DSM 22767 TaxID=1437606 RepID=A0A086ZJ66_9BIFI|nr:hypothetical protein [Bifidobacterium bohemicum]KFI46566.1 hypothetical protein BBOH_0035 [Bifidobacterium bohemicum DSM 22767]SCB75358.1 hypothetical protein GA0061078_0314 [Bifidobacterium bohemicum]